MPLIYSNINNSFNMDNTDLHLADNVKVGRNPYYYRADFGTVGGMVCYCSTTGGSDSIMYMLALVSGSNTGSPDSGKTLNYRYYI